MADTKTEDAPQSPGQDQSTGGAPAKPTLSSEVSTKFVWKPLPWHVLLIFGTYSLYKLGALFEHPCAVLGTPSPVGRSAISQAYRKVSICTHPDKMIGASEQAKRRGNLLFQRTTKARDDLMTQLKKSPDKSVSCYDGELEAFVGQLFSELFDATKGLSLMEVKEFFVNWVWDIISLKQDIMSSIAMFLMLSFVWKVIRTCLGFFTKQGPVKAVMSIVIGCVVGPFPTLLRLLLSPLYRVEVFYSQELKPHFAAPQDSEEPEASAEQAPADDQAADPDSTEIKVPSARAAAVKKGEVRKRVKKAAPVSSKEKEKMRDASLMGEDKPAQEEAAEEANSETAVVLPTAMRDIIARTKLPGAIKAPYLARQWGSQVVQFPYLLTMTKPIIPLCCLLATGQVFNGLLSSMFIGHALRNWVPTMRWEMLHVSCVLFGAIHTLVALDPHQTQDGAEMAGVLQLQWSWTFRDVLAIINVVHLGAMVTACSGMYNDPLLTCSFAAGVALRMLLQESLPETITGAAHTWILKTFRVEFSNTFEVAARSYSGVGDCGGGIFRHFVSVLGADNDGWAPLVAATVAQVYLLILPALAASQWMLRTWTLQTRLAKEAKKSASRKGVMADLRRRRAMGVLMSVAMLSLCALIVSFRFNAIQGTLANWWVVVLVGCVMESLLCTYDIRGPVRQIIFFIIFILV